MKKLLTLGLASLLLLTACTTKDNTNDTSSSTTTTSDSAAADKAAELQTQIEKAQQSDASAFPQLSDKVADNEAEVILHTSAGDVRMKLFPEYAPLAVENFLTHAKEGYYDGLIFHRVINNFMIQTGDPLGTGSGGESIWAGKDENIDSGNGFANEVTPFLFNMRGALAMANAGPDTNGSQFYIVQNSDDQTAQLNQESFPAPIYEAYKKGGYPSLDFSYTVFGQVISGMEVVDSIAKVQTDEKDKPLEEITIKNIEIVKDYKFD